MSLKAKVEAVVYAAEEPVTLAQLAGIFANEVLEELEALSRPADEVQPEGSDEAESAENELFAAETPAVETSNEDQPVVAEDAPVDAPATESAPIEAVAQEPAEPAAPPSETEEKKAARQRDRQIRDYLETILDGLIAEYAKGDKGMEIKEVAGGYRMATKPEYR
jgi:segregation and condensation protein B